MRIISNNGRMTQDERWLVRYKEVMRFLEENHRNPSRHRIEEHDMLNWVKANRKLVNAGKMKEERVERFRELMEMCERYRRKLRKIVRISKEKCNQKV